MGEIQGNKQSIPVEITNALFRQVKLKDDSKVLVAEVYVQAHGGDTAEVTIWLTDELEQYGTDAGRPKVDVGLELLEANGMTGGDIEKIEDCIGTKTTVYVTKKGDGDDVTYRHYLNSPPASVDASEAKAMIAAIRGNKSVPAPVEADDSVDEDDQDLPF